MQQMCHAPVYFCDVDPKTGLITPEELERLLKGYPLMSRL